MWAGRITSFFRKVGTKGRSKDSVVGGIKQPERQATQDWMRDISHSLSGIGFSWSTFAATSSESAAAEGLRQKILILCTDQEATQLAAVNYLKFGRSLFVEHVNDPAHRSHNDVHLALAASGLLSFSLMSIGLYNVRYGPWNKGTWFGKVQGMADEMSLSMSSSDPLLLAFFPDILADEGRSPDENTEEQRRAFLDSLPNRPFVRAKGSKASPSRFNSLTTAHSELDRDWSAFCLVLATLCVAQGWCKSAAELWSPDGTSVGDMELRTRESTVQYFSSFAHWSYMTTAREHVSRLSDLAGLERLGVDLSLVDPDGSADNKEAAVVWQDTVCRRLAKLTHCLLRFRCGSQLNSTNGWGSTAGLLHESGAARVSSLRFLEEVDKTVRTVAAEGSLEARKLLEGHPATGPVFALALAELRAGSFVEVPPETFAWLSHAWGGLLNSKLVEVEVVEQEAAEEDLLAGVSKSRTWSSPTPDSEQDKLAAFSVLAKVVRDKLDWSFVETAWWASLAPEGHGVLFAGLDPCYVVRTYGRAALVWPAVLEPLGDGHERLVLKADASSLCWLHLQDENVTVLELVATSPQRLLDYPLAYITFVFLGLGKLVGVDLFELGARSLGERRPVGVSFKVEAKRTLLEHHEQHGFAGVPEWALRRLATYKGWTFEAEETGIEEDDRLAIACMLSLDASLTREEVVGRLLSRQEEKREAKAAKDLAAAVKRCYADCNENVDRAVQATMPRHVKVYRDDKNGRWKISYSARWAHASRSISWTMVGSKAAGSEVIRQAWKWVATFEGLDITAEAQTILQKLEA
ncbi:Camkk2 [Symbiodinium necroappetens]|uniref:Camkk2 protein n=1 Tax=Symbiodinium necroappetens TaxID=1628268 RepID=A0A812WI64_9DINO|nr:Camkk2 [Symbiodinium necroappetens]